MGRELTEVFEDRRSGQPHLLEAIASDQREGDEKSPEAGTAGGAVGGDEGGKGGASGR